MRRNPTLNEVKIHAMRSAVIENWHMLKVRNRLIRELDLTKIQANHVIEWLGLPIKKVGFDYPIGDEIKEKRRALKASRKELAEVSGLSMDTIRNYEGRKYVPTQTTVDAILYGIDKITKRRYRQKQTEKHLQHSPMSGEQSGSGAGQS